VNGVFDVILAMMTSDGAKIEVVYDGCCVAFGALESRKDVLTSVLAMDDLESSLGRYH